MSSNMQGKLSEYLGDFVPCLINILKNETLDRKMKLPAFHALGDLSLNSSEVFNKFYLQETLDILDNAAEMSVNPQAMNLDSDTDAYLSELRDVILEQYGAILISVSDQNDQR